MSEFTYTPYDGSAQPFTMGLRPLDPAAWIEIDHHYTDHLIEKHRLYTDKQEAVFAALPASLPAQDECLRLLIAHLKSHFTDRFEISDTQIFTRDGRFTWVIEDFTDTPLALAGQLVQEDFCLIDPHAAEPILVAASLCFPSSWALKDKIGKSLDLVHAPVPGYQNSMATKVNRMMQIMPADRIVWRMNWSLDEGPDLHRPAPHLHDPWLEAQGDPFQHIFIRVERQTLRRLPETGFVVFTIRIYTDCLGNLKSHPDAGNLAKNLHSQLAALTDDQAAYKGLTKARPNILRALQQLS
ncbi:MAG: DUF3445 domain-containing protein [Parvularculaceae bacterium]